MPNWVTAGKVRMTPKGVWSNSIDYTVLDCVSNSTKTTYYVAVQNVPAGVALTNTDYWQVMISTSSSVVIEDHALIIG